MADLKIFNLNKNSDKFFFKKKLSLRKESKRKLIKESFMMLFISILIIYLNYLIPNKLLIFTNISKNFNNLLANFSNSITYLNEIFLVIFIIFSLLIALILILGSFYRFLKIAKKKSRRISFK